MSLFWLTAFIGFTNCSKVCVCDCPATEDISAQFLRVCLAFEDRHPQNAENSRRQRTIYPRLQDPERGLPTLLLVSLSLHSVVMRINQISETLERLK